MGVAINPMSDKGNEQKWRTENLSKGRTNSSGSDTTTIHYLNTAQYLYLFQQREKNQCLISLTLPPIINMYALENSKSLALVYFKDRHFYLTPTFSLRLIKIFPINIP
jgi:hypothetical protein